MRGPLSPVALGLLSVLLGLVAGLGAFIFRNLIALIHNLSFFGDLSTTYDANAHTSESVWGPLVMLVPVVGAVVVVFLVRHFAPEAKGHGVPEVMDAIYYQRSVIRPVVAVIKSLGSALSIGTGGSVGREGPIVQIGAAFGSVSARLARASRWQRATLVAAGGGAGIAATFNTPIGGLLFAVEILLHEVSVRTLVPVALATATSTYTGRALFGDLPAFRVPDVEFSEKLTSLPTYVVLGVVTALASVAFIRALYGTEDLFERVFRRHAYLAHAAGMLGVGATFVVLFSWKGHYYLQGVGYATIADVLETHQAMTFLLALVALKLLATSLTLGSGASGGIFSPSLFVGATLGAAFASLLPTQVPGDPAVFALAGMAGVVAGSTGAVLTATVMIFEMTLAYPAVLPMLLTASVSYGVRRMIMPQSIYTMKLARRGHVMPEALQANAHLVHHVSDLSITEAAVLSAEASPADLRVREDTDEPTHYVVADDDGIVGVLAREWARAHADRVERASKLVDLARRDYVVVQSTATLFELLESIQRTRASVAVVVMSPRAAARDIVGIVTKADLAEALAEGMELFED